MAIDTADTVLQQTKQSINVVNEPVVHIFALHEEKIGNTSV